MKMSEDELDGLWDKMFGIKKDVDLLTGIGGLINLSKHRTKPSVSKDDNPP